MLYVARHTMMQIVRLTVQNQIDIENEAIYQYLLLPLIDFFLVRNTKSKLYSELTISLVGFLSMITGPRSRFA